MKVLVLGGGGREHALAWAIAQSPRVTELVIAPGNGGIAAWGATAKIPVRCVPIDGTNLEAMLALTLSEGPDLTVIGPEIPLAFGLVDELERHGLRVFGPTKAAAELESSKAFAKQFMQQHGIPTAGYVVCDSPEDVARELIAFALPVVVKADGLAAGKGVVICASREEAQQAADEMFSGALLGAAVDQVVLEEFLHGEELSFFALCDGTHAVPLAAAQDHKRIGEGDTGPNTGGMGAYSTDALMSPAMRDWLTANVAQPVVDGMAAVGTPFKGILFCGIMMVPEQGANEEFQSVDTISQIAIILGEAKDPGIAFGGRPVLPMVLEFNTRFGDPETQALMLRLDTNKTDIVDLFTATIDGTADKLDIAMKSGASVCVIAASEGYPGKYPSGRSISGLTTQSDTEAVTVFHSGTSLKGETLVTAGGRVLGITAYAADLRSALDQAYARLDQITFEGMQFRRDIGWRALQKP
ncbi:phosphoribosylamine--glycine ligase [Granulicella aggregans]|uniref:Phosphoribosylamine--glycine ligase n=1 Tax=Granulicella aggregans TaxID=474949 RepID=A0A7W7ZBX1_9BACT|nr:phosphoribosylamine--glycine ligase [Granulicella aggregans]MBB5057069.1 phosphoribosylamine--glycine ligase [Granulicella aggregans]